MNKKKIFLILGSVRANRAGEKVAHWLMNQTKDYHGNLDFELIDLKEQALPFMDEPVSPMTSSDYLQPHTKAWSQRIQAADGFIFITPEYNHGVSPALKNAIDFLYREWQDKPVAFVGYGGSGARDSIRKLRETVEFIGMRPLDRQLGIGKIWEAFDQNGMINPENIKGDVKKMFYELEETLKSE